jgi:4'-phosphopantetheinyl transferase
MTLFPVIMPVAKASRDLSGKEQAAYLSCLARQALAVSAEKSQIRLGELLKDEEGSPCPDSGNYWSLSHKPRCVAAVASHERVGIDVEEMKPRTEALFSYVACDEEWRLVDRSWNTFFRYWTAKEATLKSIGIGIGGLRTCRIVSVPDDAHLVLNYEGEAFLVEQFRYRDHIVAVVKGDNEIEWVLVSKLQIRAGNPE